MHFADYSLEILDESWFVYIRNVTAFNVNRCARVYFICDMSISIDYYWFHESNSIVLFNFVAYLRNSDRDTYLNNI